jgi:hypothetical protein
MIKIKLDNPQEHRNEIAYRPYLWAFNILKDIGIELTTGNSYDYALVGQASIIDKTLSLKNSIEKGIEYLSNITGDYIILDGQDSTSLIGVFDVFKHSKAKLLLKNSLLKNFDLYKKGWANGRIYWGEGNYSVPDIDNFKEKIKLSGTNWVGTIKPRWMDYNSSKPYDVSCMFSWGDKKNYEYQQLTSTYYDNHRRTLLEKLKNTNYKVVRRESGVRIPQQQFYQNMYNSKITTAPIGYGEMAVRDIEAASFGSVLIKPNMDYINSVPFLYENEKTYIACKYDWSDINEKIDYVLSNYKELQPYLTENMRKKFDQNYTSEKLAIHLYNIFLNLDNISHENN